MTKKNTYLDMKRMFDRVELLTKMHHEAAQLAKTIRLAKENEARILQTIALSDELLKEDVERLKDSSGNEDEWDLQSDWDRFMMKTAAENMYDKLTKEQQDNLRRDVLEAMKQE